MHVAERLSECSITSTGGPDAATLLVEGDLVVTTTAVLEGAVNVCLRGHPRRVAVDLTRVRFMDSAGITALLTCRGRAATQRARLVVTHPSPTLARVMRPEIRALLTVDPEAAVAPPPGPPPGPPPEPPPEPTVGQRRLLACLSCGATTAHVPGPRTLGADGEVIVQWWSCTACDEGNTLVG
ncbi:STAS domain-containing protein [Nocardioides sp. L-11A]|uniref:STAS domain-containing protein n=1 Tax=Nocardioides sp. L-11A TaxID=3043848 RepID=UPI00249C5874|nr:STAS domain-containing protein [Nocardioides sp. L-11A]